MKFLVPVTIAAAIIACGYVVYRRRQRRFIISDDFNESDIQRINILQMQKILDWADTCLSNTMFEDKKFTINVLPNKATKDAYEGKISLSKSDWDKVYLIYIEGVETKKMLFRKMVIAPQIDESLECLHRNKVFVIPVE